MDGRDWFYHFQDKGAYGRVVHLQPMQWRDGWPVIGVDKDNNGVGEPVLTHAKPAGGDRGILAPPTGDEFGAGALGLQWQWNANPSANAAGGWYSLKARPGFLRLPAQAAPEEGSAREVPSVLTQKFPAPVFTVDTRIEARGSDLQRAGLLVLGIRYAWLGLRQSEGVTRLVLSTCEEPALTCKERIEPLHTVGREPVYLRAEVGDGAVVKFSYSLDGKEYTPAGQPFQATVGRWVGAQVGLVSTRWPAGKKASYIDVDYFRVTGVTRVPRRAD